MVIEEKKNNPIVIHRLEKEIKWHKKQRRRDKRKKKKRKNRMSRSHPISDDDILKTIKENSTR